MPKVSNVDEANVKETSGLGSTLCAPIFWRNKNFSNTIKTKIILLDGSEIQLSINMFSPAKDLLLAVCKYLKIKEHEIFGLYYRDIHNRKIWLSNPKRLDKQMKDIQPSQWIFVFRVKLYPSDSSQMHEDITRYYLTLQIRNDIVSHKLSASENVNVALSVYVVQSELGDYDEKVHGSTTRYIQDFNFVKDQTPKFLEKVAKGHKVVKGLIPVESDIKFLSIAMRLALYGMHFQPAKDNSNNLDVRLSVNYSGLTVSVEKLVKNCFPWQIIKKIQAKRSILIITTCNVNPEKNKTKCFAFRLADETTVEIFLNLIIEHHVYFRLTDPDEMVFERSMSISKSSRFAFDGSTLYNKNLSANNPIIVSSPKNRSGSAKDFVQLDNSLQLDENHNNIRTDQNRKSLPIKSEFDCEDFDLKNFDANCSNTFTKVNSSTLDKNISFHTNEKENQNLKTSNMAPTQVHKQIKTLTIHTSEISNDKKIFPEIKKTDNPTVLPIQYAPDYKESADINESKNESDPEFILNLQKTLKSGEIVNESKEVSG